ncbi:MAG: Ldh family oxidoreductase [Betaproteobacteria bacterium]
MTSRLTLQQVHELARLALMSSGGGAQQSDLVAQSIAEAEAQGIRNVGLAYLPTYCAHLRCGKVDGHALAHAEVTAPSILQVDASNGFAHTAFMSVLPEFVLMVRSQGIAAMTIRNSYSAGVLGWFIHRFLEHGLVSLAFSNASAMMAPVGGNKPVFGTNPWGFGVPQEGADAIVADMSSTATARVNVIAAAQSGGPIPAGWAIDVDGRPTTDPQAALAGTMAPAAGHKGYALALLVDVLVAGLGAANWSFEASSLLDDSGGPPGVGQCFIAIDPSRCAPGFAQRVTRLAQAIHEQEGARLPGMGRAAHTAYANTHGVEVPDELLAELHALAYPG